MKNLLKGEIKLAKKWLVLLIFLCVVFLGVAVTFIFVSQDYMNRWEEADKGYQTVMQQCSSMDTELKEIKNKVTELEKESAVKDIRVEMANTETEEQRAYVKEYQDILNDLKVQLALRGIETGDYSALDAIGEDFAKQYEDLKAQEATAVADAENATSDGNEEQKEEEGQEEDAWATFGNMFNSGEGE